MGRMRVRPFLCVATAQGVMTSQSASKTPNPAEEPVPCAYSLGTGSSSSKRFNC